MALHHGLSRTVPFRAWFAGPTTRCGAFRAQAGVLQRAWERPLGGLGWAVNRVGLVRGRSAGWGCAVCRRSVCWGEHTPVLREASASAFGPPIPPILDRPG